MKQISVGDISKSDNNDFLWDDAHKALSHENFDDEYQKLAQEVLDQTLRDINKN